MRPLAPLVTLIAIAAMPANAQSEQQLLQDANKAYGEKRYPEAVSLFSRAFEMNPSEPSGAYNAACCHALMGDAKASLRYLERAVLAGFTDADNAVKDTDLELLHSDARWPGLLDRMRTRKIREAAFWQSSALTSDYKDQLTVDERIAGLSRFWSEVKFNFFDTDRLVEIDWDRLYLQYLPKVRAATSTAEYYRVLTELCARLKDGHTYIHPDWVVRESTQARTLIRTRMIEGRVMVTAVFDETLRTKGLLPGVEITTVDGLPVKAYAAAQLTPYQSASTPQDLETRVYTHAFLSGPPSESPLVGCMDAAGKAFSLRVPRLGGAARDKAMPSEPPFTLRMLPGQVAHVSLNGFDSMATADQFLAAFPEIAKAKALILDMRANLGGNANVGFRILATLGDCPFATSAWSTRDYKPVFRAWGQPNRFFQRGSGRVPIDPDRHFAGPVIVLTGPATYSAAEDFAVAFDVMQRGVIFGEPTGGSTGMPLVFKLPGGGLALVCTRRDTYPDGRAFVGVGVIPGRLVRPTVADLRIGRDTVLEAALTELSRPIVVK